MSAASRTAPGPLRAWLQLFRAPNLFTVLGDPLAGYLLVVRGSFTGAVVGAIAASFCFYAAGLLMNDLADLDEDRRERPGRPLPSGAVDVRTVRVVAASLAAAGLAICAFVNAISFGCGALLALAVVVYNFRSKSIPALGAVNMGVCRGLSLLLGAAFAGMVTVPVLAAASLTTVYIAAVTHLSRFETRPRAPLFAKMLPMLSLIAGVIAFPTAEPHVNPLTFFAYFAIAIIACAFVTARIVFGASAPLPPSIGALIRVLLCVQAAFCAGSNTGWIGGGVALLLLALVPASRLVGRHFYAS